jgi:peptidoglycan/LPS O-acetylase OafA/YrhL
LFFVLSGFLVSGLLFSEYKRIQHVNIQRFLIRRGFKIYPAFYFFIVTTTLIYGLAYHSYFPAPAILSEIFFLQSYFHPMWSHTWSLAVEEHFYIFIAIFIFIAVKFRFIERKKTVILFLSGAIVTTIVLRMIYVFTVFRVTREPFYYSHLRLDGLFTGALLGYVWHFCQGSIEKFYRWKKLAALVMAILLCPAFLLRTDNLFMLTAGFNLLHIAFAIAILFLISEKGEKMLFGNPVSRGLSSLFCRIGVYSYSIYLWHLPVQNLLLRTVHDVRVESVIYIVTAIASGVIASLIVEAPMLRLRDKYFPKI